MKAIANYFPSLTPIKSLLQLTRQQVEAIASDTRTPDSVSRQYLRVLTTARKMELGEDQSFPGQRIPRERILFIKHSDGLKIYVD